MMEKTITEFVRISGEKVDLVVLRNDTKSVSLYTKWVNDTRFTNYIGKCGQTTSFEQMYNWANSEKTDEEQFWSIVEKDTRILLGICSCKLKKGDKTARLYILIGETSKWRKGYGTETILLMNKFAFEELNAHRIEINLHFDNKAALNCFLNAGYIECGRLHEAAYYNGQYKDVVILEILKRNWMNKKLMELNNKADNRKDNDNDELLIEYKIRDIDNEDKLNDEYIAKMQTVHKVQEVKEKPKKEESEEDKKSDTKEKKEKINHKHKKATITKKSIDNQEEKDNNTEKETSKEESTEEIIKE